jgi:hypothetical protein
VLCPSRRWVPATATSLACQHLTSSSSTPTQQGYVYSPPMPPPIMGIIPIAACCIMGWGKPPIGDPMAPMGPPGARPMGCCCCCCCCCCWDPAGTQCRSNTTGHDKGRPCWCDPTRAYQTYLPCLHLGASCHALHNPRPALSQWCWLSHKQVAERTTVTSAPLHGCRKWGGESPPASWSGATA